MTIKIQPKNKKYNEIYPPITEKQKTLDPNERSVYQLIELYSEIDKGIPRSYRPTKGKTLMFAKTSVISIVYDMNDVFCFFEDNPKMHAIYGKPVHLYSLSLIWNFTLYFAMS